MTCFIIPFIALLCIISIYFIAFALPYKRLPYFVPLDCLADSSILDSLVSVTWFDSYDVCIKCLSTFAHNYFPAAYDVHAASDSCAQQTFNEVFGRIIFMSDSDEIHRNEDLYTLVLLERTASMAVIEIQYGDESSSDFIRMVDLISDERTPLPVWANRKLRNSPFSVRKFYRIIRQHRYSRAGEYRVLLSIANPENPEERILRNFVVLVVPRPPIPGYFRSIFFVNNGPVQRSEQVQVALIYKNSTVTPEFIVTVDMSDGTTLNLTFDRKSPIDGWILNATGIETAAASEYYRGLVHHQYKTAGIFTAEASITSEKWSYPWEAFQMRTAIVVTCAELEVNLKNMGSDRNKIQAYPINKEVFASLFVRHGCQQPLGTGSRNVEWSVYPIHNLTSTKNESTRIIIPPSGSNPEELRIAPYTLQAGFYIVQAQVKIYNSV